MHDDGGRNGPLVTRGGPQAKASAQQRYVERGAGAGAFRLTGVTRAIRTHMGDRRHEWECVDGRWKECGGPGFCVVCNREADEAKKRLKQRREAARQKLRARR